MCYVIRPSQRNTRYVCKVVKHSKQPNLVLRSNPILIKIPLTAVGTLVSSDFGCVEGNGGSPSFHFATYGASSILSGVKMPKLRGNPILASLVDFDSDMPLRVGTIIILLSVTAKFGGIEFAFSNLKEGGNRMRLLYCRLAEFSRHTPWLVNSLTINTKIHERSAKLCRMPRISTMLCLSF